LFCFEINLATIVQLIDCKDLDYPELSVEARGGKEIAFLARKGDRVGWGGLG
jgi:hypothetical protein